MIHSVPNPKMTKADVENFRKVVCGDVSEESRKVIAAQRQRVLLNYKKIMKDNGGINPITGHRD